MCIYLESIFAIVSHFFSEYILESIITLLSKKKSIVGIIKSPEKINYQIHSGIDINESNNSMRELENILSDIRRDIGEKESHGALSLNVSGTVHVDQKKGGTN